MNSLTTRVGWGFRGRLGPIGRFAFTVATLDLQEEEVYEFVGPHGTVIATAFRRRFRPRTTLRVCANTAKSETPVEVECRSMASGHFCVAILPIPLCLWAGGGWPGGW